MSAISLKKNHLALDCLNSYWIITVNKLIQIQRINSEIITAWYLFTNILRSMKYAYKLRGCIIYRSGVEYCNYSKWCKLLGLISNQRLLRKYIIGYVTKNHCEEHSKIHVSVLYRTPKNRLQRLCACVHVCGVEYSIHLLWILINIKYTSRV